MSIKINLGAWNSVFAVPSSVVDERLKYSDGVKLKVLLFVLRNSGRDISNEEISKATGVNVTDIPEALDYWVSLDIFQKDNNSFAPKAESYVEITSQPQPYENKVEAEIPSVIEEKKPESEPENEERKPKAVLTRPQKPDYVYTTQRLAVDEELQILVDEVQISLGKTLSNSDISTLLMLKDTCGLPVDVILMLTEYCISVEKGNMRAIEKLGIQWADAEIYSVEAAENRIRKIKETTKNFSIVTSVFGLKNAGSPTKKQLEYGDKWVGEWKFSPEMLREAYERCVDSKGEMNFRYIDGILKRWNANNLRNKEDLKKFESSPKDNAKNKRSYDIDELEKIDLLDDF